MKIIRIISLLLAVLMVMSCFVSCKKDGEEEETTVSTSGGGDEYNPMYDEDGGGRDFIFFAREPVAPPAYTYSYLEVGAKSEEGSDRVTQAVYNRDRHLASTFNINIVVETETEDSNKYEKALELDARSGISGYDIVMPMIATAFSAATSGYLLEVSAIPYVDVEQEYWNKNIYETSSVGGYNFFLVGEANISSYSSVGALFFNKKLVAQEKLDNPYDLVRANQWTFDNMKSMAQEITADIDGDLAAMTYKDRWGFCTSGYMWMPLFYSAGYYMLEKDSDDMPFVAGISGDSSAIVGSLLTNILEFLNDSRSCLFTNDPKNKDAEFDKNVGLRCDMFVKDDRTLFWMEGIYGQVRLRDMESEYGILPIPKWNAESPYASIAHSEHTSVMAVMTNTDIANYKLIGAVMEEMAKFSAGELKEEFYEQTIRVRGSRDDDSLEMLDYLYENIVMDLALMMTKSGLAIDKTVRNMVDLNNTNVSHMFTSLGGGFTIVTDDLAQALVDAAVTQHTTPTE